MKKINLTLTFCLSAFFLAAQDYLVTFSAAIESDTVSTVSVENMTQGLSLAMNGNETLHLKKNVTGVSDLAHSQFNGIQLYPNPIEEYSMMTFVMPQEGIAKIELSDLSGRKLFNLQNYLNQGLHSFQINGVGNGIYILSINTGKKQYSEKLISNKKTSEVPSISYLNTITINDNPATTKSAKSEIQMQYNTGDILKFTGIGEGVHKSVIVDVISNSKNIEFQFYKCIDPDNRSYATVKIGSKIWMAENLAYLPAVHPPTSESVTEPKYYVYDYNGNDIVSARKLSNYITYGVLYNWPGAKAGCPNGWHLPSDAEWKELEMTLGMTQVQADATEWRGIDQGIQMKETILWKNEGNGTNSSGFSALPSGIRVHTGIFGYIGESGIWWSSTEIFTTQAWDRQMNYGTTMVERDDDSKECGFSVRCIKD